MNENDVARNYLLNSINRIFDGCKESEIMYERNGYFDVRMYITAPTTSIEIAIPIEFFENLGENSKFLEKIGDYNPNAEELNEIGDR